MVRCLVAIGDVKTSVKKTEVNLKRLKKVRGVEKGAIVLRSLTDDDKIRTQLVLDLEEMTRQVTDYFRSLLLLAWHCG